MVLKSSKWSSSDSFKGPVCQIHEGMASWRGVVAKGLYKLTDTRSSRSSYSSYLTLPCLCGFV